MRYFGTGGMALAAAAILGLMSSTGTQAQTYAGLVFSPAANNLAWAVDPSNVSGIAPAYRFVQDPCVNITTAKSPDNLSVLLTVTFTPDASKCPGATVGNFRIQGNQELSVPAGTVYRFKGRLQTPAGSALPNVRVGAGFEFWDDAGRDQFWMPPEGVFEHYSATAMDVGAAYLGQTKFPRFDSALKYMQPTLMVTGILPNQVFKLQLYALGLEEARISTMGILPLSSVRTDVVHELAPVQPLKLSVNLLAANWSTGQFTSRMRLVPRTTTARPITFSHVASSPLEGLVVDPWQVSTPLSMAAGTYDVYYRLTPGTQSQAGARLMPLDGVSERADGSGGYEYKIGAIKVLSGATMSIGNTFHDYPLRGTAPTVTQDFVRSLHNYLTGFAANINNVSYPNNWWRLDTSGNVVMAWDEGNTNFDKWANTFAPVGSAKKLLITFYGSPLGVGENDQAKGAWGASATGYSISAPKAAMLSKYGDAVARTVTRYKGRIFALECWNEPDSTGHYVGTPTRLADLCATISRRAKAVDSTVKVICPQASQPEGLGYIMSAKTSAGEPIGQFCDMVGMHMYGRVGSYAGVPMAGNQSLADAVREFSLRLARFPNTAGKPVVMTEVGFHDCLWGGAYGQLIPAEGMQSASTQALVLFNSLLTLKELGVSAAALYSYNTTGTDVVNGCPVTGGFSWQYNYGNATPNSSAISRINAAANSF